MINMKKLAALFLLIAVSATAQLSSGPGVAILLSYTNLNSSQFEIVDNQITLKEAALITNAVLYGTPVGDGSGLTNMIQSRPTDPGNIWFTNFNTAYLNVTNGVTKLGVNVTTAKNAQLWIKGSAVIEGTNVWENGNLEVYGPKAFDGDDASTNIVFHVLDLNGIPLFAFYNDGNMIGNLRGATNYSTTNLVGLLPAANYPVTGLTTNIDVIIAGDTTNQLQFTKGVLTGVVPQ